MRLNTEVALEFMDNDVYRTRPGRMAADKDGLAAGMSTAVTSTWCNACQKHNSHVHCNH